MANQERGLELGQRCDHQHSPLSAAAEDPEKDMAAGPRTKVYRRRFSSIRGIAVRPPVTRRRRDDQWSSSRRFREQTSDPKVAFECLPLRPCDFRLPSSWIKRLDQESPPYIHIRRNVYLTKKTPKVSKDDGMQCSCKGSKICSSDCICRLLYTSCSSSCACEGKCENLPFQKRDGRRLRLKETENCGWGLFADENIERGDFLIEYIGEVIDDKTCEERLWDLKERGENNFYLCEVGHDKVIDATFKGNMSRFINHSCNPNAQLRKWQCDGELRIGVFAVSRILKGQEITYDYKYIQFGTEQQCHCGSKNCKGILGGSRPTKLQNQNVQGEMVQFFPQQEKMDAPETQNFSKPREFKQIISDAPSVSPFAHSRNSVGHRVRVWWPLDQKYYSGRIIRYNASIGKHQILYDDGDEEEISLLEEKWSWEKKEGAILEQKLRTLEV
ncbi:histone-lysine N-methyltransferase ASHH3 isoform X2 [Selaginella moellendorffii]|uniref:histone-lysine N-methyltransferase ASHH3 isoform X2 n=1 Tax=Selaginella moellendorffii TaxID=88036 RepID=UPI000D1CC7C3|nr:histone-lysine N-methyltransferase ASHH3 isoform X2 [Selaginella moellendorffii]|eukprot:XP_024523621.1 histone-lysine N-methyltransferase ASHH3 isoform X2 [Selaginella moellendorffii]